MSKPSLYAKLPKGTRLHVSTPFVSPDGPWYRCHCTVVRDLGEDVEVKASRVDTGGLIPSRFTVAKCCIHYIV